MRKGWGALVFVRLIVGRPSLSIIARKLQSESASRGMTDAQHDALIASLKNERCPTVIVNNLKGEAKGKVIFQVKLQKGRPGFALAGQPRRLSPHGLVLSQSILL
jgi:hypothetical protein